MVVMIARNAVPGIDLLLLIRLQILNLLTALLSMEEEDWKALTVEQYRVLFKGSAVKRAKLMALCGI